ncbi:MAG: lysostaphin resistance A-like protein [Microgenomates group bacterium]
MKKIWHWALPKTSSSLKHPFALFSFIFVFWAIYRYFPGILSEWLEELILKPILWLVPTLFLVKRIEKNSLESLGFTKKNLFPSLYWGIGLGMIFALEGLGTNILKYKTINFANFSYAPLTFLGSLFISFATAFTEETVFRGYIFSRLWKIWKNEWLAGLVSSFLFTLIHLPIAVFVLGYTFQTMLIFLFLVFTFGFASAFVFSQTQNIASSILLHVFWSWPIILFR